MSGARSGLEPVASRTMGTPPAGDTSTAGSSSSRATQLSFDGPVGDGSRTGGVGVKAAQRPRGVSPSCVNATAEAQAEGVLEHSRLTSLDTPRITRPDVPERVKWLGDVERTTDAHRVARAQRHERRAVELKAERL